MTDLACSIGLNFFEFFCMNINFSIFFAIPLFLMIFHQIINSNYLINLNKNKMISQTIKIIFRINFEINWTFY